MKNIALNLLLIASIFLGTILFNACDEGYRINTKENIREEQELMDDYLYLVKDSLDTISTRVVDSLENQGYLFYELEEGVGDTARVGKEAAFRYVYYEIARDSTGTPVLYRTNSNYSSESPAIYTVGEPVPSAGIFSGVDEAIQNMTYDSKALVFISSSLWLTRDFIPRVIEIELTYLEK